MKITVFTSNQPRHIYLLNQLSSISDSCHAIIGSNTLFPGQSDGFFKKSNIMQRYFSKVLKSEEKFFGGPAFLKNKINALLMKSSDLNMLEKKILEPSLNSDIYIVFGATYIKGWLADELVRRRTINLHMGISPYYRGSSCNFWACYNKDYHLVGSTIHMLSKGLDSGNILYHAVPTTKGCETIFDFTMKSVKVAIQSLQERIVSNELFKITPSVQDSSKEISYTKNADFNDTVATAFIESIPSIATLHDYIENNRSDKLFIKPFYG